MLIGGQSLLLPEGRLVPLTAAGNARAAYQATRRHVVAMPVDALGVGSSGESGGVGAGY
jgi:hypothetical protein